MLIKFLFLLFIFKLCLSASLNSKYKKLTEKKLTPWTENDSSEDEERFLENDNVLSRISVSKNKYKQIFNKNDDLCRCSAPIPIKRVVNGTRVVGFEYEWVVAIYSKTQDELVCTGSLLSATTVLTAGHCQEEEDEELVVLAGFFGDWVTMKNSKWGSRKVIKFIKHPKFEEIEPFKPNPYDVAILELDEPFELGFNYSIYLACILNKKIQNTEELDFWFAGYGVVEPYAYIQDLYQFTPYIHTKGLNHLRLKYDLESCKKNNITEKFICLKNQYASLCNVDSGGGVHIFVGEKLVLVSTMSSGEIKEYFDIIKSFCFPNSTAITLKIYDHLDFIKNEGKAQCLIN